MKMRTIGERDRILETLWSQFEDVPMDPDTEEIEEQYLHFPPGTHREEIWHWFDERHSKGVAHLLYMDGIDRTDDVARYIMERGMCQDCDARDCAYNPDGICKLPLVYGRKPVFDITCCCDYTEREGGHEVFL